MGSKNARADGNEGVYVGVRPLTAKRVRQFKKMRARKGLPANGADNPADPFYWRFVEFGHRIVQRSQGGPKVLYGSIEVRMKNGTIYRRSLKRSSTGLRALRAASSGQVAARPFLRPAAAAGERAIQKFMDSVIPQIEKLNRRR